MLLVLRVLNSFWVSGMENCHLDRLVSPGNVLERQNPCVPQNALQIYTVTSFPIIHVHRSVWEALVWPNCHLLSVMTDSQAIHELVSFLKNKWPWMENSTHTHTPGYIHTLHTSKSLGNLFGFLLTSCHGRGDDVTVGQCNWGFLVIQFRHDSDCSRSIPSILQTVRQHPCML